MHSPRRKRAEKRGRSSPYCQIGRGKEKRNRAQLWVMDMQLGNKPELPPEHLEARKKRYLGQPEKKKRAKMSCSQQSSGGSHLPSKATILPCPISSSQHNASSKQSHLVISTSFARLSIIVCPLCQPPLKKSTRPTPAETWTGPSIQSLNRDALL